MTDVKWEDCHSKQAVRPHMTLKAQNYKKQFTKCCNEFSLFSVVL